MLDLVALLPQCAPAVASETMAAIVRVESSTSPYAIGVVGGRLVHQPRNLAEAVATARKLEITGWNFSVGVGQINRHNLRKYGLTYEKAFDACTNLGAGSKILKDCYERARLRALEPNAVLQAALSCYHSGNFTRGFIPDVAGQPSYVQKVWTAASAQAAAIPAVPLIRSGASKLKTRPARPSIISTPDDQASTLLKPAINVEAAPSVIPAQRRRPTGSNGAMDASDAARTDQSEPNAPAVVF